MVQAGLRTMVLLQLQFIDMVFDVCCAGPAISGADWEKTAAFPQLQLVVFALGQGPAHAVVCNDRRPVNCDVSQLLFSRCGADRGVMPQIMDIVQVFSLLVWLPQVHFWRL